jgi:hypothetical protein
VQRSATHDMARPLTLAAAPWTAAEKDVFARVCGDTMRRLSYPM